MPEPDRSAYFADDGRTGRLFVLSSDTLYRADVAFGSDAAAATVTVTTRPLKDGVVRLTQHGQEANVAEGYIAIRRSWRFIFRTQDAVDVTGWVRPGGFAVASTEDAGGAIRSTSRRLSWVQPVRCDLRPDRDQLGSARPRRATAAQAGGTRAAVDAAA